MAAKPQTEDQPLPWFNAFMLSLTKSEELSLLQLQQVKFWSERGGPEAAPTANGRADLAETVALPQRWELTQSFTLHAWQTACVQAWFDAGRRGVLKVVTGAGKTILALAIAQRLQNEQPSLRVAIIVPTVILLDQWREEFAAHSNLPASAVGLMGGGHNDHYSDKIRVLICVLNSAAKKLPDEVQRSAIGNDLLLIVDECHRAGSAEMKHLFSTPRSFSLGLSATPERNNDETNDRGTSEDGIAPDAEAEEQTFEESVIGQALGPVVFELNYAEAIRGGVLPPFQIVHCGLSLTPQEWEAYDRVSRNITDLRAELESGSRRGLSLIRWCHSRAGAQNPRAAQFLSQANARKRMLFRMEERFNAVLAILRRAFSQNPETKAILFHESIEEVMALFGRLRSAGYAVVAEHSGFPDSLRAESLQLFRQGTAQVIVSAKSLIEGFNVPSADLGIIVAASSSVRQRVQTLGRLLRRNLTADGAEKQATLYVLYASETVDEMIYAKADWESFVGADRNEYLRWESVEGSEPLKQADPPRRPPVDESSIDRGVLVPGGIYPGDSDQGALYSLDLQGMIRDESGALVEPCEKLSQLLAPLRRGGGRFRITPKHRFMTRLEKVEDRWQTIYLGQLDEPLKKVLITERGATETAKQYSPGDSYPLHLVRGKEFSVLQRDKRLIAVKQRGQVNFVVPAQSITDPMKRAMLEDIQLRLAASYRGGHTISKITVTAAGHVVYLFNGVAHFVGQAPEGAEGFVMEKSGD